MFNCKYICLISFIHPVFIEHLLHVRYMVLTLKKFTVQWRRQASR